MAPPGRDFRYQRLLRESTRCHVRSSPADGRMGATRWPALFGHLFNSLIKMRNRFDRQRRERAACLDSPAVPGGVDKHLLPIIIHAHTPHAYRECSASIMKNKYIQYRKSPLKNQFILFKTTLHFIHTVFL